MNFCLSDLVPPLRWSDAATIPLLRDQPGLPDAWWRSLPLVRVLTVLGPERLAEILTTTALEQWPAAAVGDVLPALYVLDPDEADEPHISIALDRAGSWSGLLALTGRELYDQPFIKPVPVLNTLFTAVFNRMAHPAPGASRPAAPELPPAGGAVESENGAKSAKSTDGAHGADDAESAGGADAPDLSNVPKVSDMRKVADTPDGSEAPETSEPEPQETPEASEAGVSDTPEAGAPETSEPEAPSVPRAEAVAAGAGPEAVPGPDPVPSEPAGPEAAAQEPVTPSTPARETASPEASSVEAASVEAASREEDGPREDGPEEDGPAPGVSESADAEPVAPEAASPSPGTSPSETEAPEAEPPAPKTAAPKTPAPKTPAPQAPARKAPARKAASPETVAPEPDAVPVNAVPADAKEPKAAGAAPGDGKPLRSGRNLHTLLDGAFADLDDKSWAVAQNRVFSDTPAAVEALSKLFAVQPEVIDRVEAELRHRLEEWLASDKAAPYRRHLAEIRRVLGKAAPKARLIGAAPWHSRELRSLDVPAWQFVLATLPGYQLADEWLVEGDIVELRHRTRDVISGAKPPLTMTRALELVASLGVHPEVAKEWLESVPQLRILGGGQRPAQRGDGTANAGDGAASPGPPGSSGPPGPSGPPGRRDEAPGAAGGEREPEPAGAPFRPLKDVSLTRRCFRQPDGRWWLRIDVTAEHIQGAEYPLPSGFAAYLGMSPGSGRRVRSAVGELGLSWQERPVLESLKTLLEDAGAKQGSHLFLTLSDEGVLRARHLPAAGKEVEPIARALRLVGYTAPGGTPEQAARVIATRVGMTGPVGLPDLLARLRERGDRDLLSLLA
ncbi:hypothetical protein [Streptosporangium sp. NPDC051022]|uniref:hypothetical protein n=1 Tax=Streptosporangium sp. NPDC051022 TaxID=3155752 RepID=UPI0034449565